MPNRRDLELDVIVVALMMPVLAMLHLWALKHLTTKGSGVTADMAEVATNIL